MSPRTRRYLAQAGSFVVAALLLYLALRGVDLRHVLSALGTANYALLVPLIVVVLLSHLVRAWRWQVLIKELPEAEGRRPSIRLAFSSLMIGYMVNYAAPRLGEVVRTANLANREHLTFSGLFGTVVVERILDMVVLLLALGSVLLLLLDRFSTVDRLFIEPIAEQLGRIPAIAVGAAILMVAILIFFIDRQFLRMEGSAMRRLWESHAIPMLTSFKDGVMTLVRTRSWGTIVISTVLMWFFYLLMAHIPFIMLGMAEPFDISLLDSWSIMLLGAVGVVIPSPGGIGSYHYITIQTLVHLCAVTQEAAASYAVLTHAAQLVLYVLVGAACLLLQGSRHVPLPKESSTNNSSAD